MSNIQYDDLLAIRCERESGDAVRRLALEERTKSGKAIGPMAAIPDGISARSLAGVLWKQHRDETQGDADFWQPLHIPTNSVA